jgi:hypothetical protein
MIRGENSMLTITVNGSEMKVNIGCRTFVSLDVLLRILEGNDSSVTLNGRKIGRDDVTSTLVQGGDSLALPGLGR